MTIVLKSTPACWFDTVKKLTFFTQENDAVFTEASAKDGENVDYAFTTLAR